MIYVAVVEQPGMSTFCCLVISVTSVVWIYDTFQYNVGINQKFTKYSKENCRIKVYADKHILVKQAGMLTFSCLYYSDLCDKCRLDLRHFSI